MFRTVWLFFAFSSPAFAITPTAYEIHLSLEVNGKKIFTPHVAVQSEKTVSVKNNEYFMDITPTEQITNNRKAVLLHFVVGKMRGTRKEILSQPKILALENQKAEISVFEPYGKKDALSISAVAARVPEILR